MLLEHTPDGCWRRVPPTFEEFKAQVAGYSAARVAYPAVVEHQARLNRHYRAILDNAVLAQGPMIVREYGPPVEFTEGDGGVRDDRVTGWMGPMFLHNVPRSVVDNYARHIEIEFKPAKEDTMAKRQTKAQKNAARRAKYSAQRRKPAPPLHTAEEGPSNAGADEGPETGSGTQTAAVINPEIETAALLVSTYLLFCLGYRDTDLGELFNISSHAAYERVCLGRVIADRQGIAVDALATRNRAMRENAWADGARGAAKAMQERIVLAIPAFMRSWAQTKMPDGAATQISFVTAMIKGFSPSDVVEVSAEARSLNQNDTAKTASGAITGRGSPMATEAKYTAYTASQHNTAGPPFDRGRPVGRADGIDRDPRVRPTLQRGNSNSGSSEY